MKDQDYSYTWAGVLLIGFALAFTLAATDVGADPVPEPTETSAPFEYYMCINKKGCNARSRKTLKVHKFFPGDILGPKNWEVREWNDDWEYHWTPPR